MVDTTIVATLYLMLTTISILVNKGGITIKITTREITLVSMFAALTTVGAFIRIPIPYVPFTLQLLFVILAGLLLGSRLGLLSQIVYLAMGLSGLPVFAEGGGFSYVLRPTFGYLLGFAASAWLAGKLREKNFAGGVRGYFVCCLSGLAVVYLFGVLYLYIIMNYVAGTPFTIRQTLWFGVVICLPGDLFLCGLGATLAHKIYGRMELAGLRPGTGGGE